MNKIALATMLVLAMGGASAQVYVGGTMGQAHQGVSCSSPCDGDDTGYKVYGGYSFAPNVSAEFGYVSFGTAKVGFPQIETNALFAVVAGRIDFAPHFSGVGRIGLANVDATYSYPGYSYSESNAKLYYGLGLEYAFTKNLKGVVAADFTEGELQGDTASVRLLSIGAQFSF